MTDLADKIAELRKSGFNLEGWTVEEIEQYITTGAGPVADSIREMSGGDNGA